MVCIDPVADYQKRAREVLLNALRGRIWGLYLADGSEYGPYGAVDVNVRLIRVWGVWVVVVGNPVAVPGVDARLDSVCRDGDKYDIFKIKEIPCASYITLDNLRN